MNVAILGFDLEGRSSLNYFAALGHSCTILDQNPDLPGPPDVPAVLGENYLKDLGRFDLIVRTAGLNPDKIFAANPGLAPSKVTTQLIEFMRACPSSQITAVTGTKGKGTTSTLIYKMLAAAGFDTHLGGNIGVPMLDLLPLIKADSQVVLELSSFQLSDFRPAATARSPHVAVCLMVVPEHLDWHKSLEEYYIAKSNLFNAQKPGDIAIYYGRNDISHRIASASNGRLIPYFETPGAEVVNEMITIDGQSICAVSELKLLGEHNWQNVCAAVTAVWQTTQNVEAIRSVLVSFTGLEHRLEYVAEIGGVKFYDDSFGTTPETAIVAIRAFNQPKVLILGGSDKGADYTDLAQTVASATIRKVLLIGQQAERIGHALQAAGLSNYEDGGQHMEQIIDKAAAAAQPGDVVLLSPACASFDMFKNYKDRGKQFKRAVRALASTGK